MIDITEESKLPDDILYYTIDVHDGMYVCMHALMSDMFKMNDGNLDIWLYSCIHSSMYTYTHTHTHIYIYIYIFIVK